jgi:hypothetical protein
VELVQGGLVVDDFRPEGTDLLISHIHDHVKGIYFLDEQVVWALNKGRVSKITFEENYSKFEKE